MPFYSPVHVINSGKPYRGFSIGYNGFYEYIKGKWMLTASECKMVGVPVLEGEEPDAYVYTVKGDGSNKYCGLYDRTNKFNWLKNEDIEDYLLLPSEMRKLGIKRNRGLKAVGYIWAEKFLPVFDCSDYPEYKEYRLRKLLHGDGSE